MDESACSRRPLSVATRRDPATRGVSPCQRPGEWEPGGLSNRGTLSATEMSLRIRGVASPRIPPFPGTPENKVIRDPRRHGADDQRPRWLRRSGKPNNMTLRSTGARGSPQPASPGPLALFVLYICRVIRFSCIVQRSGGDRRAGLARPRHALLDPVARGNRAGLSLPPHSEEALLYSLWADAR